MNNTESKIYLYFSGHNIPAEYEKIMLTNFVLNVLQQLNYELAHEAIDLNNYKKYRNTFKVLKTLCKQFELPFEFVYCLN